MYIKNYKEKWGFFFITQLTCTTFLWIGTRHVQMSLSHSKWSEAGPVANMQLMILLFLQVVGAVASTRSRSCDSQLWVAVVSCARSAFIDSIVMDGASGTVKPLTTINGHDKGMRPSTRAVIKSPSADENCLTPTDLLIAQYVGYVGFGVGTHADMKPTILLLLQVSDNYPTLTCRL